MSAGQNMASSLPLAGVRVLDLTRVMAGPFATMMLGDLGAEVVKVENPDGGDITRSWGTPLPSGESTYFLSVNRNKKCVAIDFSNPEGVELVRRLCLVADVVIENYKHGTLDRYGLGPADLLAINPRLIYVTVSGYGRTGPAAERPGYDFVTQGETGLMSVTGPPEGPPSKVGVPIADLTTGLFASQAILAALMSRERDGKGQVVDVSLHDCLLATMPTVTTNTLLLGRNPSRFGNAHDDIVPYNTYPTRDGDINVTIGSNAHYVRMCNEILERPDLATDPRFATNVDRRRNRAEMDRVLAECFRQRPHREWAELFKRARIPVGIVRTVTDALQSEETTGRDMLTSIQHPTVGQMQLVSYPVKFSETRLADPLPPPLLGEHTYSILQNLLGLSAKELDRLEAGRVILQSRAEDHRDGAGAPGKQPEEVEREF